MDVKLPSTSFIDFHFAHYLPRFATPTVPLSADTLPVYIFLKWFCVLFSQSTAANYSRSLFYFSPPRSQCSLGFAFPCSHSIFFSILCLILFHIHSQERGIVCHREWKGFWELIFIFCAMPMAFSECVMCYYQVLIMQLKCKKFKSSALLALSAVCTLPKALFITNTWSILVKNYYML